MANDQKQETAGKKRRDTDWDACHRDYRTGKYTQRELAEKYGVSHAAVGKKIREQGWQKDLTDAIRQETNARLAAELVRQEVARGVQDVSSTVSVAAEANAQIILKHRGRIADAYRLLDGALETVLATSVSVDDPRSAASYVSAIKGLLDMEKTLEDRERRAHNIDADESKAASTYEDTLRAVKAELGFEA